ncbi:MAG: methionine synthase [Propionibacteriaceae bacterium]|jgi:5-methyltetrahydrofolate--homocysteine methyltransferase|nr:methionine synthase [Propionibacteriaceae bacterium]
MSVALRSVLGSRILVADGAMGTMLQPYDLTAADFGGFEGCNELLNLSRPEIVSGVHKAYLTAGADLIETNTFGANLTALGEYGLTDMIEELAEAGARLARQAVDEVAGTQWVLGSVGPGTKLPSLGQISFAALRDGYHRQVTGLLRGGVDGLLIETCQDLLAIRAAVVGAKRAIHQAGVDCPILVSVTVELTGSLLVGSDLSAVVGSLAPLGIDALGLNCATGPADMGQYLRALAAISPLPMSAMPNAGLPELSDQGACYTLGPAEFAAQMSKFATSFGLGIVGGCCGTTPDHIEALAASVKNLPAPPARLGEPASITSLYTATPLSQETAYLAIGERTNAAGSKAFREAMLAGDWEKCVEIARAQVAEGAHVIDLCVDQVGRDGLVDMAELVSRISREVDVPIQLDSSNPEVLRAGLECYPGRAIVNSVHFESGDGPDSKFAATMAQVSEHGSAVVALCIDEQGQARTLEAKVALARRLIETLTRDYGLDHSAIIIDPLTYPIGTGQSDTRRDGANTIEAIRQLHAEYPAVHFLVGVSNVSFGLSPAARVILNSLYLDQCRAAGMDCAIVAVAKILPLSQIPEDLAEAGLNLIWDRWQDGDPLERFLTLFEDEFESAPVEEIEAVSVEERLRRHIIEGTVGGLTDDLELALETDSALVIINQILLEAMREVGARFGQGRLQLPFVLKSAEVMKQAVNYLEPHLERAEGVTKGTLVLATVRGDVHDIGKNLVEIILSNNGYRVVNLGIKQPIADIITAAEAAGADAIGMSGLLVKSTQIMKENLEELNARQLAQKYPILLGGAALTRAYVEQDLAQVYDGAVRYAKDAFEGLALMDTIMEAKAAGEAPPEVAQRRAVPVVRTPKPTTPKAARPQPGEVVVPTPPFTGVQYASVRLPEIVPWLDKRALFAAQWGLASTRDGPSYDEIVAQEGEPRLKAWLERAAREELTDFRVAWGYWPCYAEGDDLLIEAEAGLYRLPFPRQADRDQLCIADFFRNRAQVERDGPDVIGLQLVTVGSRASRRAAELYHEHSYRDYFEWHGLSVQLAEAFAEMWHARVRAELGLEPGQGTRYSFGYPSCPDLEPRRTLLALLKPEKIGVILSAELQLQPEQSTEAFVVHHPKAHYFRAR